MSNYDEKQIRKRIYESNLQLFADNKKARSLDFQSFSLLTFNAKDRTLGRFSPAGALFVTPSPTRCRILRFSCRGASVL